MDACQNWAMMDAMTWTQGTKNALIGVSTTVFGKNASCVLMPIPQGAFTEELVALFQVFLLSSLQALMHGLWF